MIVLALVALGAGGSTLGRFNVASIDAAAASAKLTAVVYIHILSSAVDAARRRGRGGMGKG